MNKLVAKLNKLKLFSSEQNYFRIQAEYFEMYAAELMKIDIEKFREETELYNSFALELVSAMYLIVWYAALDKTVASLSNAGYI